jgi:choline dehydrogenase-like flavoprotein
MGLGKISDETTTREDGWHASMSGGKHHMGTTRMHADPRCGVVDPDCRVHGISNLFIAGSSVFPTTGYANPTLTIVALALRLADYLKVAVQPASKHKLPRLIHPKCAQSALPG